MLNLRNKTKNSLDSFYMDQWLPDWVDQPKQTHSGHPIREVPWELPYYTQSLCPECTKVIKARKFEEDGKVWMENLQRAWLFQRTYFSRCRCIYGHVHIPFR